MFGKELVVGADPDMRFGRGPTICKLRKWGTGTVED